MNVVDKWRPRRTIIFCSWGAEEYGLIGSTEWIEVFRITHALALCVPVVRVFVVEVATGVEGGGRVLQTRFSLTFLSLSVKKNHGGYIKPYFKASNMFVMYMYQ